MLYNENEIYVMRNAIQPNMRDKRTNVVPFKNIVEDFFHSTVFAGTAILDIGPGQCDFLDIARIGGATTYGVDFDLAVVELGTLRRHRMTHVSNIQKEWPYPENKFNGIFCRGSFNYFFSPEVPQNVEDCLRRIFDSAKQDAWIWIAPFAKYTDSWTAAQIEDVAAITTGILNEYGITVHTPTEEEQTRYGVQYIIPIHQVWTRFR